MFTSFIDAKIVSQLEATGDENLRIFDLRIHTLRAKYSLQMVRTPTYEKAQQSVDSGLVQYISFHTFNLNIKK